MSSGAASVNVCCCSDDWVSVHERCLPTGGDRWWKVDISNVDLWKNHSHVINKHNFSIEHTFIQIELSLISVSPMPTEVISFCYDRYMEGNKELTRAYREEVKKLKERRAMLKSSLEKSVCFVWILSNIVIRQLQALWQIKIIDKKNKFNKELVRVIFSTLLSNNICCMRQLSKQIVWIENLT